MPHWSLAVHRIGNDAAPVIVIDNFAPDPGRFVDDAEFLAFRSMGEHYPGVRAPVPRRLLTPLLTALAPVIAEHFGLAATVIEDALYSLVTVPPAELRPIQRLPHFDGVEPDRLALLHYLSPHSAGGTAFYRHRSTGFETITAENLAIYRGKLDADLQHHGLPMAGYIGGDTAIYDRVAGFAGIYNRALLYRGNLLHCADIPDGTPLVADVRRGRFTANAFLRAAAPAR